ncbi:hypothetical protein O7626_19160 [Micromonospora sp. WMMD1102]|uniref:hypothetical protein n=1 Tax=Micromonospora sp. WMMD1102 TaxID=3016105 RepID=UPI0024152638|nr:hypothetical protein [Micromonospora sp. WMMD1102]MDG4788033.1 hypothetical protein [Micromonospora sp. WMMD1102]
MNDTYGDPFIPEQVANTVTKLAELRTHQAPIAIFTKAGYHPDVLARLAEIADNDNIIVYYSLTGLDEGGISFDERLRFIAALTGLFRNVFVFTRPIIRRRNDSPEHLRRLAQAAAELTGQLVLGGLHDAKKRKQIERPVELRLLDYCDELGVRAFHKTSCAAAWTRQRRCWVHDIGAPGKIDVAASLGYRLQVGDDRVVLHEGSTGDINFVRMLTGAEVYVDNLLSNYNLLTIGAPRKLEMTSSWFAWSENIDTCLDCSYCIIKQIEYLKKMQVRIGVHPTRLPEIVDGEQSAHALSQLRGNKLAPGSGGRKRYGDVRIEKPCRVAVYQ